MAKGAQYDTVLRQTATLAPELRDELCRQGMVELEPYRAQASARRVLALAALLAAAACTFLIAHSGDYTMATVVGALGLVLVVVLFAFDLPAQQRYTAAFDAWRNRVLQAIRPNASLEPNSHLPKSFFDAMGINQEDYNRYSGDTLLHVGNCSACNLWVRNETRQRNSKGETETDIDDVFTGILIRAQVSMPHSGWVVLNPRWAGVPQGLRSTEVVSPKISKSYTIAADSPFVAHRILDPSKQQALESLVAQTAKPPRVAYRDNVMAVGLDDMRLDLGHRPSLLRPVRAKDLEKVAMRCEDSVAFVTHVVLTLAPEEGA